jgi:hypothetical protein
MAEPAEHGGQDERPSTDLGRVVQDVLKAAPQFVATLQSRPDELRPDRHHHRHHGAHEDCRLEPGLGGLIEEIREGLDKKRSPAGVIAACGVAMDQILAAFGGLNGKAEARSEKSRPKASGALLGGVLLALAAVAAAFLFWGARTDVAYAPGSDPDYRQLAYQGAVDTPNLGTWMAWIVLALAVAGAVAWVIGHVQLPPPRGLRDDHPDLKDVYDRGLISRDIYERGAWLVGQRGRTRERINADYANEYAVFVMALADALCHRRKLDDAALYRSGGEQLAGEPFGVV